MNKTLKIVFFGFLFAGMAVGQSCKKDDLPPEPAVPLELVSVNVGTTTLSLTSENTGLPIDQKIRIRLTAPVDTATVEKAVRLTDELSMPVAFAITYFNDYKTIFISSLNDLEESTEYHLLVSTELTGKGNETFEALSVKFTTTLLPLVLKSISIDENPVFPTVTQQEVDLKPEIKLTFSHGLSIAELSSNIQLVSGGLVQEVSVSESHQSNAFTVQPTTPLAGLAINDFKISADLRTKNGNTFEGYETRFYTQADETPKFPIISNDELLTKIQQTTFNYFWDFAHPVSGLARERNTSGETVTSGGSGFGLMALIVGIERGFITRSEGIARLQTIVDFLGKADRFHGAWPHWMNGTTGAALPFSAKDNGGDLVETSFLAAGLLTVRQYLNSEMVEEEALISKINELWKSIEWDWYTKNGESVLYWHWSPNFGWEMNHKIQGYNEALITYILAAASETHPISAEVYHKGWARNGAIKNGKDFYGINLPLGFDYGGPLFFAHYSFLGINPNNLADNYANYWVQNKNHTLINRAYCIDNPNNYVGYGNVCWGLTASDNHHGYSAHSPTNDLGVITPTAAIASLPYTPDESLEAIRFFYYTLGDRLWGEYGFYDAFNLTEGWTADSYLAIDQGPIVIMIENYRTGLIWDLLMSSREVQAGLTKLSFTH